MASTTKPAKSPAQFALSSCNAIQVQPADATGKVSRRSALATAMTLIISGCPVKPEPVDSARNRRAMIDDLRRGKDVVVSDVEMARGLLDGMTDLRPFSLARFAPSTSNGARGTFVGNLLNPKDPVGELAHPPGATPPSHVPRPHYFLWFHDGRTAAIVLR